MLETKTDGPDDALRPLLDPSQSVWFTTAPRSGVASAWYGHVPFAFWLMQAARPRLLVELGTHNGVSYSAFCEAAKQARLETRCFAVDTWQGDEHAGFYGAGVFAEFERFHEERYGGFSRLLRMRFDDAAAAFADGSIDLLHIDGCHAYQAVRHDFETWRPKLSRRAIVLFHDTNVRERQFGVWRLWQELCRDFPHFEFVHEHGLGVLAVGPELDGPALALCRLTDPAAIAELRLRFAHAGRSCQPDDPAGDVARRTADLDAARNDAARLELIALAQETRAAELRADLAATKQALAETRERLEETAFGFELQRHELAFRALQIEDLRRFEQAHNQLISSTSWRVTEPLRRVVAAVPAPVRRGVRLAAKAGLWLATPWTVGRRLERRRQIIALAHAPQPLPEPAPVAPLPPPPPPADRFSLDPIARPDTGYVPLIQWFDPVSPEVSVIVLNWQGVDMTLLCLQHLWQHTTGHRYEIIVVDNGSAPDEVARLQQEAPLVRVIALGANRYFGEANNIGVEAARGRFVCLLNNDAFVPAGWLEGLRAVFERESAVGAVGPRFVYPGGALQEVGASINADGTVTQLGKGEPPDEPAFRLGRVVDYVSAACVLLRREDFLRVLGFDLAWEPAYYEDVDLCLKLRVLGLRAFVAPEVEVVHIENATSTKRGASLELGNVVAINRTKFLGRWGRHLADPASPPPPLLPAGAVALEPVPPAAPRLRVAIYTPYQLAPGGGERYVLTMAEAFKDVAEVWLVTPHPVSRIRLLTMGRDLGLDLEQVVLLQPGELATRPAADIAIALGNEIFPTTGHLGTHNLYICQFPFPFAQEADVVRQQPNWGEIERVLVYSDYVRVHVEREAARRNVLPHPIEVLAPPVPMVRTRASKRPGQILHVGRFFAGFHCKRQDELIEAFRLLLESGATAELHLAGTIMPEAPHRAYYAGLLERAAGLPVRFHANCSTETLHGLYAESELYWHATGFGADLEAEPHRAEHFGISVVEAMSAGCIPLVYAAGGPATVVADGVTGFHFRTLAELAERSRSLLAAPEATAAMRAAAAEAAQAYDEPTFRRRVREIADRVVQPQG